MPACYLSEKVINAYDDFLRYAHYLGNNYDDARDVVQEAFLKGFRHGEDPNLYGKTWMNKIVINCTRERRNAQKKQKSPSITVDPNITPAKQEPCPLLEQELLDSLEKALSEYHNQMTSAMFKDFVFNYQSYEALTQKYNLPLTNVQNRLTRIRQYLRKKLRTFL